MHLPPGDSIMPLPKDPVKLELWRERQRISQTGRIQPESQIRKRQETRLKNHPKLLTSCANCGKTLDRANIRILHGNCYCNGKCQMAYEYKNGVRDPYKITMKSHEATRQLAKEGKHPFQRPDVILKAQQVCGHRNYGKNWLEEKMGWALTQLGIKFESQYPIKHGIDSLNRPRYYFPDFAIPEELLLIECDGSYWHNETKDRTRQDRLGELGWNIIRFTDTEINNNLMGCADRVKSLLPVV